MPQELGRLSKLVRLDLCSNKLSGSIPQSLGGCASLEILSIAANPKLSGGVPASLGGCKALRRLNLMSTSLDVVNTGIPKAMDACTQLEIIDMRFSRPDLAAEVAEAEDPSRITPSKHLPYPMPGLQRMTGEEKALKTKTTPFLRSKLVFTGER